MKQPQSTTLALAARVGARCAACAPEIARNQGTGRLPAGTGRWRDALRGTCQSPIAEFHMRMGQTWVPMWGTLDGNMD